MASYNYYQPTLSNTWVISHNLNSTFLAIDTMMLSGNSVYVKFEPAQVQIIDSNNISVSFNTPLSGRARIVSATNM